MNNMDLRKVLKMFGLGVLVAIVVISMIASGSSSITEGLKGETFLAVAGVVDILAAIAGVAIVIKKISNKESNSK